MKITLYLLNHHNKMHKTLLDTHNVDHMLNIQTVSKLTKTSKRNAKHINLNTTGTCMFSTYMACSRCSAYIFFVIYNIY